MFPVPVPPPVRDTKVYVDVAVGLTEILTGLGPVAVKLLVPSVTVTVYGDVPPVTATLKLLDEPEQIVASPLNTEDVGGVVGAVTFSGCKADTVFTKQLPQAVLLFEIRGLPVSEIVVGCNEGT